MRDLFQPPAPVRPLLLIGGVEVELREFNVALSLPNTAPVPVHAVMEVARRSLDDALARELYGAAPWPGGILDRSTESTCLP